MSIDLSVFFPTSIIYFYFLSSFYLKFILTSFPIHLVEFLPFFNILESYSLYDVGSSTVTQQSHSREAKEPLALTYYSVLWIVTCQY